MEHDRPLPKFGEWDVNDPASAEGFTVIFNKARNEKRTGGKPDSPRKGASAYKNKATLGKPQSNGCDPLIVLSLGMRNRDLNIDISKQPLIVLSLGMRNGDSNIDISFEQIFLLLCDNAMTSCTHKPVRD
ncbi:hypothetical protein ACH5RR_029451 [Cinchona calisaya]|uniref:RIN4 pathogenic type III effector avirulence factor Avr cleavage site domain-containing protein n=1 Tax=Cinchona calisaya TaxID=153742 RepID=A0ABD2YRP4_9GENT